MCLRTALLHANGRYSCGKLLKEGLVSIGGFVLAGGGPIGVAAITIVGIQLIQRINL